MSAISSHDGMRMFSVTGTAIIAPAMP